MHITNVIQFALSTDEDEGNVQFVKNKNQVYKTTTINLRNNWPADSVEKLQFWTELFDSEQEFITQQQPIIELYAYLQLKLVSLIDHQMSLYKTNNFPIYQCLKTLRTDHRSLFLYQFFLKLFKSPVKFMAFK